MKNTEFVKVNHISKSYSMGEVQITALQDVSFNINKGEFVVIVGESGAGKTTVLNLLGGMDKCDEGEIIVDGNNIAEYNEKKLTKFRRNDIGFVFQFFSLMPNLTAVENVELSSQLSKNASLAELVMEKVGLFDRMDSFPSQLSGGEQQRVSIARALVKIPQLLLCDEPTGALDYNTGKQILKLLQDTCKREGVTVVVITHNQAIVPMADRVIHMKNGQIEKINVNSHPAKVDTIEW